jgi:UDP-3-O-[3-hydroxymyristoyl] glucosamine N-acyltransferase
MEISAEALCALLAGILEGDPEVKVTKLAPIESAGPGDLSFVSNPKYEKYLATTAASVVLLAHGVDSCHTKATIIRLHDVYQSLAQLMQHMERLSKPHKVGIEPMTYVSASAQVGEDVYIGAFAYVGDGAVLANGVKVYPHCYVGEHTRIGSHTILYPGARCYPGVQLGSHCVVHSGAVIGADGFGFAPNGKGGYDKIPQLGNVVIGDHVEIGANSTIDRAALASTKIGDGAKIDNLVMIAHNVEIGRNTAIVAQAGISGSTKVGEQCVIGGQAGLVGHISIANNTRIGARAGVGKSLAQPGKDWSGVPLMEHKKNLKIQALIKQLPLLFEQIHTLSIKHGNQ